MCLGVGASSQLSQPPANTKRPITLFTPRKCMINQCMSSIRSFFFLYFFSCPFRFSFFKFHTSRSYFSTVSSKVYATVLNRFPAINQSLKYHQKVRQVHKSSAARPPGSSTLQSYRIFESEWRNINTSANDNTTFTCIKTYEGIYVDELT